MRHRLIALLGVLVALVAFVTPATTTAHEPDGRGTVYTISNAASGNAVLAYTRMADGSLHPRGTFATGGLGTGAVLASQGAVILGGDGRWLAAVDAGSSDIALFAVGSDGGLQLTDRVAAGGTTPISLTIHGRLLYVLDAGGSGNIAGFAIFAGHLFPLPGSIQPLGGPGTSPEEIGFNPAGNVLVVTEKGANALVAYAVGLFGVAGSPKTFTSAGAAPYGFAFDPRGRLFVTEAAASALSSYRLSHAGAPSVISASVVNGQQAACWVALTPDGHYAFTIDAHNPARISAYAIAPNGSLTLVNGAAAGEPTFPLLDAAVSGDGRFLYVVDVGANAIDAFRIGAGGSLTSIGSTTGLPAGAGGLAAS